MLRTALCVVCGLFATVALQAQNSSPAANYGALKEALGLSTAQVRQLEQLQAKQSAKSITLYEEIAAKQKRLNELFASGSKDASGIGELEIDLARLRNQPSSVLAMRDDALAVLDPAQKTKLGQLENALRLQRAANEALGLGLIVFQPPQ